MMDDKYTRHYNNLADKVLADYAYRAPATPPPRHGVFRLIFVSVEMATAILSRQARNRAKGTVAILRLSQAIEAARFQITHQGIAFNEHGELCDGQHRLEAIVAANEGVWLWAYFGLHEEALYVTDINKKRNDKDRLNIGGIDCTQREVTIVKRMRSGSSASVWTFDEEDLRGLLTNYLCAVRLATELLPPSAGTKVTHAAVQAVIGMASFHESHSDLARFCAVLTDGVTTRGMADSGAIKLYKLLSEGNRMSHGEVVRAIVFKKTQTALRAFLDKRHLTKLYETEELLWELPEPEDAQRLFDAHADSFMREQA